MYAHDWIFLGVCFLCYVVIVYAYRQLDRGG